ncbi:MAG TPA: glycosyltransferase family 4 protein [Actinomycetota bacterium]|nr:glycosyltransferase family 4 protein [Actinomycetota bacterium]
MRQDGPGTLSVLRICSVFEPPGTLRLADVSRFDPIGGMQNHTAALTRALDRRGVRQTVITARPAGAPRRERMGAAAEVIRLGWPIRRLRQLYSVPAVAEVRRPRPVDLVHVHLGEDLAVVPLGVMAMRAHAAPMIMTIHCSLAHTFVGSGLRGLALRTIGGRLERAGVRRAAGVICLTAATAELVRRARPGGVSVIPSGIERRLFGAPHPDPVPDAPRPRVLYAGRLAAQKGVARLVEAFSRLRSPATLLLVGDGPERPAIERRIRARRLADRVRITGFVHHRDVPSYLANADVLVLPSVYEELGSILVEAMAAGVPVVASAVGGIPFLVRHGENGLLWDSDDTASLAEAIDRVVADGALRRRLRRGGRATAAAHDWDSLADRVLEVYEASVRGAPSRRAAAAG